MKLRSGSGFRGRFHRERGSGNEEAATAGQRDPKASWRERKRLERGGTGDSPEELAEPQTPEEPAADRVLRLGGFDREGRFKRD